MYLCQLDNDTCCDDACLQLGEFEKCVYRRRVDSRATRAAKIILIAVAAYGFARMFC